jgi:hypothetical protein
MSCCVQPKTIDGLEKLEKCGPSTTHSHANRISTYGVRHEIEVRKGGSKVGPINIGLPCAFRKEEPMAARTKDIDCIVAWQI